jgi:hypothetical protein
LDNEIEKKKLYPVTPHFFMALRISVVSMDFSSFLDNRTFRVVFGAESLGKTHTKNGVMQGAVMSVTLFLVALADIVKQVQEPVAIYTSDQDMETGQTNIQSALNNLSKWSRRKGRFHDIAGKNDSHAHMQKKKPRPPRPIRQILEVKNTHKILGITFDNRLT